MCLDCKKVVPRNARSKLPADSPRERLRCHGELLQRLGSGHGDRLKAAGIPILHFQFKDVAHAQRVIAEAAPDVFHSFSHKNAVEIAAASAAGVPVIAASRVNIREWDQKMGVQPWEEERNRMTHHVCAVSAAAARVCNEVEGVPRQKIRVIHNGVPLPAAGREATDIRVELGISSGNADHRLCRKFLAEGAVRCSFAPLRRWLLNVRRCALSATGIASPEEERPCAPWRQT